MHAPLAQKTVMIVEDEPAIRSLLCMTLESEDYKVVSVQDGQEALDSVQALEPDAILLDMMLPRVDGFGVIASLDAEPGHIPIVAMTAGHQRPLVGQHDVKAFLSKPYDTETLLTVLRDVLDHSKH